MVRALPRQSAVSVHSAKCVLPVGACLSEAGSQSRCPTRSRTAAKTQNRSGKDHHAAKRADNSNYCSRTSDTAAMSHLFLSPRAAQLQFGGNRPSVSLVAAMFACIAIGLQAQQS